MPKTLWGLVLAVGSLTHQALATEQANVRDPPGQVDVDQPAGVSLEERNTERDTTDTLAGGGRTEVIQSVPADVEASAREVDVQASDARMPVAEGSEERASYAEEPAARSSTEAQGDVTGTAESTSLGADTGHGTGTETPNHR